MDTIRGKKVFQPASSLPSSNYDFENFDSNRNSTFSTLLNSRHSVQKAVDLTTPDKNRDKMCGKKWHFQIKKVITLVRKFT